MSNGYSFSGPCPALEFSYCGAPTRRKVCMSILTDRFGRKANYLRISITDRCNLRCRYCMPAEGVPLIRKDRLLTYEEIERFVRICCRHGLQKVRITGGEPTVRRDLVELVQRLRSIPELIEVNLTTNGMFLAEKAQALQEAGLTRINLSLDTLRPDRFESLTRRRGFEKALQGLEASQTYFPGSKTQVNVVLIRGINDDEILDFARFAQKRDLMVRFIEFMPMNADGDWNPEDVVPSAETLSVIQACFPLESIEKRPEFAGPAKKYRFRNAPGGIGVITPVSQDFCSQCNRMRLSADGRIRPCLLDDYEVSVRDLLRAGATDEAIEDQVFLALSNKVEKHSIGESGFSKPHTAMVSIGG